MAKRVSKLLDAWIPPEKSGEPIGCLATSFTFDNEFFEDECLKRFLNLETELNADGPIYLIEREEKLSNIDVASVLVDQSHCKGKRSLRWDLLPFRNKRLLHAKISLLYWSNNVRVIIASANITDNGYRKNQEVFAVLDFNKKSEIPKNILIETVDYLTLLMEESSLDQENPGRIRWMDTLEKIKDNCSNWGADIQSNKTIKVTTAFLSSSDNNIFDQLKNTWESNSGSPANKAMVISPFFNDSESKNEPAKKIWDILRKRGKAEVSYYSSADKSDQDENKIHFHAPETLTQVPRKDCRVKFNSVPLSTEIEGKTLFRSLHQKSILIKNNDWQSYLIGSSNFTSSGLGLYPNCNYEANLIFTLSKNRIQFNYRRILDKKSFPDAIALQTKNIIWQSKKDADQRDEEEIVLHECFLTAFLDIDKNGNKILELNFNTKTLPSLFSILLDENLIYDNKMWINKGKSKQVRIILTDQLLPSGLWVIIDKELKKAWWPILVKNYELRPPPEDLSDLPIEVLISILSSAKPLHQVLKQWLKNKSGQHHIDYNILIDPHEKVDTYSFLLKRTRRVTYALNMLCYNLERPFYSRNSLHWRINGPVGVMALAKAIMKEAKSDEEKVFLLAEIALDISKVSITSKENSLDEREIKEALKGAINQLKEFQGDINTRIESNLKSYVSSAMKKAYHEL